MFSKSRRKKRYLISRKGYFGKSKKNQGNLDKVLLTLTILFTLLGCVAIADTSSFLALSTFSDPLYFLKQQIVWSFLGIIFLLVGSFINYTLWKKISVVLFITSIVLLILVLVPSIGSKVLGARRWINFGPASFQPSELVKLSLAIYMAHLLEEKRPFWVYLLPMGLVATLIMFQPDLGTTIIVVVMGVAQLFISGVNIFLLFALGTVGFFAGVFLIFVSDYRKERIISFLKSLTDPLGSSYHVRQILLALGSGGLFGVGIGQSRQKYLFLPEVATDSVFAVIAEEIGFVGASALIIGLSYLIYRMIRITSNAPDPFAKNLAMGITVWFGGQVFLNIGSMLAVVPLTGIPLPFFSYGGSNLVMLLLAIGILLNISKHARET